MYRSPRGSCLASRQFLSLCWEVGNRFTGGAYYKKKTHQRTSADTSRRQNRALGARAKIIPQSINKRDKRARHVSPYSPISLSSRTTFFHVKYCHTAFTPIFVCVRLLVATAIWRTVIHCYYMIVLLTQYVGLVWNPPTHLSICHSAIAYTLYYSDG